MKVSLIIAVYKDVDSLELIFDALAIQTYTNFEVVVAEDGEFNMMSDFIQKAKKKYAFNIIHTTQEDKGVQKSKNQNNGIQASTGEYLIFIDGDCLPYHHFIERHIELSKIDRIVAGRRVNLGAIYSQKIRSRELTSQWLETNFIRKYWSISQDAKEERHTEEGFTIKPNGLLHQIINVRRKKRFPLLGCNMSMYKSKMLEINGFDEGLGNASVASDTDLEWRFQGIGCSILPARFVVNEFHLYHKRSPNEYDRGVSEQMGKNKKNALFFCQDGIVK